MPVVVVVPAVAAACFAWDSARRLQPFDFDSNRPARHPRPQHRPPASLLATPSDAAAALPARLFGAIGPRLRLVQLSGDVGRRCPPARPFLVQRSPRP